jgi:hypothetical protein
MPATRRETICLATHSGFACVLITDCYFRQLRLTIRSSPNGSTPSRLLSHAASELMILDCPFALRRFFSLISHGGIYRFRKAKPYSLEAIANTRQAASGYCAYV